MCLPVMQPLSYHPPAQWSIPPIQMISSEVPIMLAKAAECFIRDLTVRAYEFTLESNRRTMQVGVRLFCCRLPGGSPPLTTLFFYSKRMCLTPSASATCLTF